MSKPESISAMTVGLSGIHIITASISSLLVIIAIAKDPFKELRTQLALFILSSACASLLCVPVNSARLWVNHKNASGINLLKGHKEAVIPITACKIMWFTCLYVSACCLLAIMLEQILFPPPSANNDARSFSCGSKLAVMFIWLVGCTAGLMALYVDVSSIVEVSIMFFWVVSICAMFGSHFCIYRVARIRYKGIAILVQRAACAGKEGQTARKTEDQMDDRPNVVIGPSEIHEVVVVEDTVGIASRNNNIEGLIFKKAKMTASIVTMYFACMSLTALAKVPDNRSAKKLLALIPYLESDHLHCICTGFEKGCQEKHLSHESKY
eukprot:gene17546-19296_t